MKFVPPIPLNNPITWTLSFFDEDGNPFDPTSGIEISVNDPQGNSYTFAYPEQVTLVSNGVYSVTQQATVPGDWIANGSGTLSNGEIITTPDLLQTVSATRVVTA
jgi:hypothetical protein